MLNPSLDDKDIDTLDKNIEPVNVKPRFENPKAEIDSDKSVSYTHLTLPTKA